MCPYHHRRRHTFQPLGFDAPAPLGTLFLHKIQLPSCNQTWQWRTHHLFSSMLFMDSAIQMRIYDNLCRNSMDFPASHV